MRLNLPRLDGNQNIFFQRQLESIDQKVYDTLFAGMLGRRYVPLIEGVPEWANVYTYRMYERTGQAKVIGNAANDLPRVGVTAVEASRVIKQIGAAYGWTVREIQQAAATDQPLDEMTVMSARSSIARQTDDMIALGNATFNITGLLNVAGITPVAATGVWSGLTPDQILADINGMIATLRSGLKQAGDEVPAFAKFTILLPSLAYSHIASTARSANSDTTILKYAIANNPWIESIEEWWKCDTAAANGTSGRAVAYPRDPLALGALVPQEFTSLAPQEEGLEIVVPCTGSCGGVVVRYTVAMAYVDGVQ